jgi:hypothetical protein
MDAASILAAITNGRAPVSLMVIIECLILKKFMISLERLFFDSP